MKINLYEQFFSLSFFFRNNLTSKPTTIRPSNARLLPASQAFPIKQERALEEHRINEDPGSGRKYGQLAERNKKVIETPVGPSQHYRPPRDSLISVCEL